MRFRHHHNHLAKTLVFGAIHVMLAITIGWLLSGSFVFGTLLALIEPVCNTVVSHGIGICLPNAHASRRTAIVKSVVVGMAHLTVALSLVWILTGSLAWAWLYALLEPVANAVAHYFFERWWHRDSGQSVPALAHA
jgi:uncharacterized membrane protein